MRVYRTFSFMGLLLGLAGFLVCGCVPLATDSRKDAFRSFDRSFSVLDESPHLHEVIQLDSVKVHIVGHRRFFNYARAAAYGSPVLGYATSSNEIWVFGKYVKGKIVVNQAILGHELMHLLNFKNPKVADPDKLDDLGA